jgi:hypothetical protein
MTLVKLQLSKFQAEKSCLLSESSRWYMSAYYQSVFVFLIHSLGKYVNVMFRFK